MSDKKDTNRTGLTEDDCALWQAVTEGVKPMQGQSYTMPDSTLSYDSAPDVIRETIVAPRKKSSDHADKKSSEIDKRTNERLRRGQMPVESVLDLHGKNQGEARESLHRFILSAHEKEQRCVLVITGKGRTGPGVLRKATPEWLGEAPIAKLVLKFYPAKPKDGGEGALYVYLRRRR